MVSVDTPERNREFAARHGGGMIVLSDPEKTAARAYGVLSERGFARRVTFYIDPDGRVRHVDREVSTGTHGADIARRLAELGYPRRD